MLRPVFVNPATAEMARWSLFDHAAFLLRSWLILLVVAVVCGGLGFVLRMGTSYEAEGVARVGWAHGRGFVEPINDVVARINTPPFLNSVVVKNPELSTFDSSAYGLKATVPENSGLIQLEATAPTEALASKLVQGSVDRLVLDQKPMMDHFRERTATRLAE